MREISVDRQVPLANECRGLAFFTKPKIFNLHHRDNRVIVIGLHEIDISGVCLCHSVELVNIDCPATAHLYWISSESVVPFDGRADTGKWEALGHGIGFAQNQKRLGTSHRHHAVIKCDRVRNQTGRQVLSHSQWLLHDSVRITQGIAALRDTKTTKVLTGCAERVHVVIGQQTETGVGPAGTVRPRRILGKTTETRQQPAETVDMIGVASDTGNDVSVSSLNRSRRPAQGRDATGPASGYMIKPAGRQSQMLRKAHSSIRKQGKTGYGKPVQLSWRDPGCGQAPAEGPRDPVVCRFL